MIPVFLGCETSDDIGIPYQLESDASVRFEEFILPTSTVVIDSLRTDSENRILVGQFMDELTGFIRTESYFSMKYESSDLPNGEIEENFVYDSVRISLLSPSNIGNGSSTQSFNISLLTDTLSNLIYLSSNEQTSIGEQIGTFESQVSADTNYFNFLLDDTFGRILYGNVSAFDPLAGSTNWPSLVIAPNSRSEVINEIQLDADTSRITLFVTEPDGRQVIVDEDTTFVDTLYSVQFILSPTQFLSNPHYVRVDRSGVNTNLPNTNLIDVLAGITTSIDTQPLQDFFDQLNDDSRSIIINNAALSFDFEQDANRDTLENFYSFFYKNDSYFAPGLVQNPFGNLIMSDNAFIQGSNVPALSVLVRDTTSQVLKEISVNATLFFQSMYNDYLNSSETSALLDRTGTEVSLTDFILLSSSDVTLQRTVFKDDGIRLRLYYTEVD